MNNSFIIISDSDLQLLNGGVNGDLIWGGAIAIVLGVVGIASGGGAAIGAIAVVGGIISIVAGAVY